MTKVIPMRFALLFFPALLCLGADLQVPSDVQWERGIAYTSVPHGKLMMDIVRAFPGKAGF